MRLLPFFLSVQPPSFHEVFNKDLMENLRKHFACFVVLEYKGPMHDVYAIKVNHGVELLEN